MLEALRLLGVQAALDALEQSQSQTDEKRRSLELALQKARYEAGRIERQYQATEPENRLVAAELEKRWNTALTHAAELERRLEDATASAPQLTPEQREQLLALGDDLERLWGHSNSPISLKKRILRTTLEEVVADTTADPPAFASSCTGLAVRTSELIVKKEQDRRPQPRQPGRGNGVDSRIRSDLQRRCDCRYPEPTGLSNRCTGILGRRKRVQHVRHTKGIPVCPAIARTAPLDHDAARAAEALGSQ